MSRIAERRARPRISLNWPASIRTDDSGARLTMADLRNISCRGAYFTSNRLLSPGDHVEIQVLLPRQLDPVNRGLRLTCRGPIVRAEEIAPGKYGLACTFDDYTFRADDEAEPAADHDPTYWEPAGLTVVGVDRPALAHANGGKRAPA
jgi:hypothetical protein